MAGPYTQVAQEEQDRNDDDASPPISLSPALSSSPMPLLRSVDSTFTPVSMDSDSYPVRGIADKVVAASHHDQEKSIPQAATDNADAVDLAQSVTASARATAAIDPRPTKNEYDLLSPSSGAVDAASSGPSSPISNLDNTRPDADQQKEPTESLTYARDNTGPTATTNHNRDPSCTLAKSPAPIEGSTDSQHTTIVKPKPILRTASTKRVNLIHPSPTVRSRSSSHASNIAQLEATAEKLSMTSSIEDAIRDLHEEQKRSDSRRSSILAASTGFGPDYKESFPFTRQVSGASSILETNNAARHGGYSPAGYVMSPNNSLLSTPSRLRSASHSRSDPDSGESLTRNGPGKSSTRSAKSTTKPSLTDIAEMEPTGLTLAAMDEADKLGTHPEEEETTRIPALEDVELTPNADHQNNHMTDYWGDATAEIEAAQTQHHVQRPRSSAGSTGTYEQAEMAFADFDGAHCSPEADEDAFEPPFDLDLTLQMPVNEHLNRPRISGPRNPTARPKSYLDPATGQQMMYYPARVPMMLNLPQKLSKKPKAAVRNQRRSQVLSAMPEANRQSAAWLPEVLPEPLFDPLGSGSNSDLSAPPPQPDSVLEAGPAPHPLEDEAMPQPRPNPQPVNEEARKSRMSVMDPADKRKSRMSYAMNNLPPQLRASAFFDMPSESPHIELKDGSAMATLDSILDASAKAPVSAFTDHAFAGKLGNEIYGTEKRKSHMRSASTADVLEVKKRSSIFHLRAPSKISIKSAMVDDRRNTITSPKLASNVDGESDDERTKLSGSIDGEHVEEQDEENEVYSDDDPALHGPPTTLLAELQIRKRQQKMRTKAPTSLYPNGMHSTLLEIDAVVEMERKNRKGKKINLAWEGPNDAADESDDEDVPLGLLAAKKNGNLGVNSFQEMNRPLGLMERRNLEDNEPLSRRRDRLQGRPTLAPRRSLMTLGGGGGALGMSGGLGPPSPSLRIQTPDEDEHEGETLAERMRRLRAQDGGNNPLPQARPVSAAFSTELLSQLGDTFKGEQESVSSGKGKERAALPEEEETLGQRRRRLQAEREAREKEMGAGAALLPPAAPMLTKRHSMADVLGATRRTVLTDPRADAERARQDEAARFKQSQEQKLAGFRAQLPNKLSTPNLHRSGGYMAGQYNDGTAGGLGQSGVSNSYGVQAPSMQPNPMSGGMVGNSAYGMGSVGGYPMHNGYSQNALGYNGAPLQMQMLPMPMQQPGQQYDRVDRWRQSIVP
ncbi:hypothetical protein SCAR479_03845 [Seiridium cardinale]|uniref:Uncharacterized protein n=1 Tax=Seiridium cardinale TaxID=138064 RepID=A0ABR2XZX4_9PEZI